MRGVRGWLPLTALAASSLTGCIQYTRVDATTVSPEEEVRVRVTRDAAIRVGPHLGTISENLEGRLAPFGDDSVALAVWIGKNYVGSPFENAHTRVALTPQEIVEVRRRKISVMRTAILGAGMLVGTALLVNGVVFADNPNSNPDDRPYGPPEEIRVMRFGLRFGW
jgi:hypothetical protein